jgi:CRISPR-associated endonuclease/helicase Cas3
LQPDELNVEDPDKFFERTFGNPPFNFQREVCNLLCEGKSVILRAPTGAGKTRAALFPFLFAHHVGALFPRQMIYSLPLRSLAGSLFAEANQVCARAFPNMSVTLQTGEQPDDPQFLQGDIIFATYDQSLSSFLTIPVGLSRREGNINAGAIISSYLVFDEFHLMEAERALATMAAILGWLKGWTPFLLMTATLPDALVERLAKCVGSEALTVSEADLCKIPSQSNKRRIFRVNESGKTLSATDILATHRERSIAVCNTVQRAQRLFEDLCLESTCSGTAHEIILLHSRFLPEHRNRKEERIREWLAKDPSKRRRAILVATQVIEVGLDVTCEHLHTEIAPAAAIIQRAGRCARFPGESGTVHIYDVPEVEIGNKYLPYDSQLSADTWKALGDGNIDGQVVGYLEEQRLIQKVYEVAEQEALTDTLSSRRAEIAGPDGVMTTLERADYRKLVRFIDNRMFFVHRRPQELEDPLRMQTFSVSPGMLARAWKELSPLRGEWFAQLVIAEQREPDSDAQGYTHPPYRYELVTSAGDFFREYFFVINPTFVDYTEAIGLRFGLDGHPLEQLIKTKSKRKWERYDYALEAYRDHILEVWESYQRVFGAKRRFDYVASRLSQRYPVQINAFSRLVRATIAGHDVGKLADDWRRWVEVWQREYKQRPAIAADFYAHTDYDPATDRAKQAVLNARMPRPTHAAEGARALADVLAESFPEELARAAYTAIVRHHSPQTDKVNPFRIPPLALSEVERVFTTVTGETWQDSWREATKQNAHVILTESIANELTKPDGMYTDHFLVYLLLLRALRISDQQALARRGERN